MHDYVIDLSIEIKLLNPNVEKGELYSGRATVNKNIFRPKVFPRLFCFTYMHVLIAAGKSFCFRCLAI